jgi:hypothetical protein
MKETTVEYLLGAVLRIDGVRWRVMELDRNRQLRTFALDGTGERESFDLEWIRYAIMRSVIEVE